VAPTSGPLTPIAGQLYCSQFVMKGLASRTSVDPDPRQQAPFEVGDFISYSGTLLPSGVISAHTIEANVGIYTEAGTQPSYAAIGEFGLGSADPNATSIAGAGQETQNRIFLESSTTDPKTALDIYLVEKNPNTGVDHNRWITPFEMTGVTGGGINTADIGPQPQRQRIRATKAPTGWLTSPTRNIRVSVRSLCDPTKLSGSGLDDCLNNASKVANGLKQGQYTAPIFEYIFPENVRPGDVIVPNDLWDLGFLSTGEGPGTGPLTPAPW
jgi:hypothetical protein